MVPFPIQWLPRGFVVAWKGQNEERDKEREQGVRAAPYSEFLEIFMGNVAGVPSSGS